jgi:hypothetical protein
VAGARRGTNLECEGVKDLEGFKRRAEQLAQVQIKSSAVERLWQLYQLLNLRPDGCVERRVVDEEDASNNCVLGFREIEVKQPDFNREIREIVSADRLWHGLKGNGCTGDLKKPTWVVYELLRQIGVRPQKHSRGPKEHDPDPKDFMYAQKYVFIKELLVKNRHRLQVDGIAKGRSRNPGPTNSGPTTSGSTNVWERILTSADDGFTRAETGGEGVLDGLSEGALDGLRGGLAATGAIVGQMGQSGEASRGGEGEGGKGGGGAFLFGHVGPSGVSGSPTSRQTQKKTETHQKANGGEWERLGTSKAGSRSLGWLVLQHDLQVSGRV